MTKDSDVVAVDTGGTFTDIISWSGAAVRTLKVLSTPQDPALAVARGLRTFSPEALPSHIVHGTTVATNALLERKGANTALVTNAGFEDLLLIGRQARPDLYALHVQRPPSLVPRDFCFGIPGRLGPTGEEISPLDLDSVPTMVQTFHEKGINAVVVALLHAYANPAHEIALGTSIEKAAADLDMDLDITLSTEVLPEFREVERTATATVNAYVRPIMSGYLQRLAADLGKSRVRVMQSNGGSASADHAARLPVHTILSGPAGGVVGAIHIARLGGFQRILTFDMGGTSTDVALCDGGIPLSPGTDVGGLPVRIPMIDIHTVGAGGGSIAWTDKGGALRVGPQSAGAAPGPACYGKGGATPTVTDANLVRGRLHPDHFLGGEMGLDVAAAERAVDLLANSMGGERDETALGICAVANAVMERALKGISVSRGMDPADFTLVTFGGAGGMHASDLAASLRIPTILVPPHPGLLSALGMLVCDVQLDFSQTVLLSLPPTDTTHPNAAKEVIRDLFREANDRLKDEGVPEENRTLLSFADMRYHGQSFEMAVPFGDDFIHAFHEAHERRYGFALPDSDLEIVTLRVRAIGTTPTPVLPQQECEPHEATSHENTRMLFEDGAVNGAVFHRKDLSPGAFFDGPALVVEYSSTTTVPPGWTGEVDPWGNLVLRNGGAR